MKITRLELENWMGIPRLQLDFTKGINILYGRNEIGKSSIVEAVRFALLEDAGSNSQRYKVLRPWGTKVKARVDLTFTTGDGVQYRLVKSFPAGGAELYKQGVKITDDPRRTQEQLYRILDISEKTDNLFKLLFINQGESLEIFNKKSKENPLNDNTKSYIKEVIKETAFKDLQAFKDHIRGRLDAYFTGTGKIKSKSPYKELLEREQELARELEDLRDQESRFREKLDEIENTGKTITEDKDALLELERQLQELQAKKARFHKFEKTALAFSPIKRDYDEFNTLSQDLRDLQARLPVLFATRDHRVRQLKERIAGAEAEEQKITAVIEQLKAKKREGEAVTEMEREFLQLQKEYLEVVDLREHIAKIRSQLPHIFARNRARLQTEAAQLEETIAAREKKREELAAIEAAIDQAPVITQEEIKRLKKIEVDIARNEDRIESAGKQLQLSFRMTPHGDREIPYTLRIDRGAVQEGLTRSPLSISGFQRLSFGYPGHLDIQMDGNLAEVDFDAFRAQVEESRRQLTGGLAVFHVDTVEKLEEKAAAVVELKNKRQVIRSSLDGFADAHRLQAQREDIREKSKRLEADIKTYCGDDEIPVIQLSSGRSSTQGHGEDDGERLIAARTKIDAGQARMEQILTGRGCSAEELETHHSRQESQLKNRREAYRRMAPETLTHVTQDHLEKQSARLAQIKTGGSAAVEESRLLEQIATPPEASADVGDQPLLTELTSQRLRDDILQTRNRVSELETKTTALLAGKNLEDFNMGYFRRKEELEVLEKELQEFPPVGISTIEALTAEISLVEGDVRKKREEKSRNERLRERLIGETADFSRTAEEKSDREWRYGRVLEDIRGHIVNISTLKLLDRFIDEAGESAQQEVFKPLQERVARSFSSLVGDRYKIGIDDDLNLDISGRDKTGGYRENVGDALSFGTKEQLSFLFRLAIASQLSAREAGVMVLDDSFVNTDNKRFPGLLEMLTERSEELQFLVFTCRPDDYLENQTFSAAADFQSINLEEVMKKDKEFESKEVDFRQKEN